MFVFIQGWRPRALKMLSKSSGKMLQTQPQWDDGGKNRWIVNLLMALLNLSLFSLFANTKESLYSCTVLGCNTSCLLLSRS